MVCEGYPESSARGAREARGMRCEVAPAVCRTSLLFIFFVQRRLRPTPVTPTPQSVPETACSVESETIDRPLRLVVIRGASELDIGC